MPPRFLKSIDVAYANQHTSRPHNSIQGFKGCDTDISFGGKYVWLIPEFTNDVVEAATNIEVIVQGDRDSTKKDLAMGAGGSYRYVQAIQDVASSDLITEVCLCRSDAKTQNHGTGGWRYSRNLNEGCSPTHLYIMWKTTPARSQGYMKKPPRYLKYLDVVYTDSYESRPLNSIKGLNGCNTDINKSCEGKYVWLIPEWTSDKSKAATSIEVLIQSEKDGRKKDIAKGAGGSYRYVQAIQGPPGHGISNVWLHRTKTPINQRVNGVWHCSTNINQGRLGGYLYVVWTTIRHAPEVAQSHEDTLLIPLDQNHPDFENVCKEFALRRTHQPQRALKVVKVFRINKPKSREAFMDAVEKKVTGNQAVDDGGKVAILYHGTSHDNALSIVKGQGTGFKPSEGGMLGKGVYLAPDPGKSSDYPKSTAETDRCMIRCLACVDKSPQTYAQNQIYDEYIVKDSDLVMPLHIIHWRK